MRPSFSFGFVVAISLLAFGGFGLYGRAQTGAPPGHAESSLRDESGRPKCLADGSAPNGEAQCWCEPKIVRGDYRDPKHEYEVRIPDGIAKILACGGPASGFHISLATPDSPEGDWARNQIAVSGKDRDRTEFPQMIDAFRRSMEEGKKDPEVDQQFNDPERTSLSFLPALHLKSSRTVRGSGKIIVEQIIANNPDKNIVYSIMMVTPADQYEKNEKLFRTLVEGFQYVPARQGSISDRE